MADFDDLLKSAKLPEASVPICLRGDLAIQFEQLERELEEAREAEGNSLADGGRVREIAEEIERVRAEMREHTHPFAFRGLPKQKFRDLVEEHPARKDEDDDAVMGVNISTFPQALIAACCTDPIMTAEQVHQLCELLTEAQVGELFSCAYSLNKLKVDVPKSVLASEILAKHAQKSKRRGTGGSLGGDSLGGSLGV